MPASCRISGECRAGGNALAIYVCEAFDPETIAELDAKRRIGAIAKRRAAGKAFQGKKSR